MNFRNLVKILVNETCCRSGEYSSHNEAGSLNCQTTITWELIQQLLDSFNAGVCIFNLNKVDVNHTINHANIQSPIYNIKYKFTRHNNTTTCKVKFIISYPENSYGLAKATIHASCYIHRIGSEYENLMKKLLFIYCNGLCVHTNTFMHPSKPLNLKTCETMFNLKNDTSNHIVG